MRTSGEAQLPARVPVSSRSWRSGPPRLTVTPRIRLRWFGGSSTPRRAHRRAGPEAAGQTV